MFIDVEREGSVEALEALLQRAKEKGVTGVLLLACDANGFTPQSVDGLLQSVPFSLFGGIFPEVIYKDEKLTRGSVLLGFQDMVPEVHTIKAISSEATNIGEEVGGIAIEQFETMFVFVDAFSTQIESVINELYYEFGVESNFIGGGAGSLSFVQKPCLFSNEGLIEDAALLVATDVTSGIGVKHGWQSIEGPFQITDSDKNVIKALDYKPAFEVYKSVVEAHSGQTFTEENFFDIAKGYPFGVTKIGNEKIVRDPITQENGAMVCVGNVKTGEYVDILSGNTKDLIDAAVSAYSAGEESKEGEGTVTLFIDCISRVLFLQDEFQKELDAVAVHNDFTIGALTLGEIANTGSDYLEFYNKTAVVGVL
jgi:hypothetical protein